MTSASSVERGRWKFVRSASTRRNSKPGVTKSSVRPLSRPVRATVSSTRTVVVPTARTRSAAAIRAHSPSETSYRSPCSRCSSSESLATGRKVSSPTWSVTLASSSGREELGGEVKPGRGRGSRAGHPRVDGLVALRIGERLVDVRRKRRLPGRVAVQPDQPSALPARLEELDRPEALARAEPAGRPRERLPGPVGADRLEKEDLGLPARRALQPQPRGNDPRVVDDHELTGEQRRQLRERPMLCLARATAIDEQARVIAPLGRMLRDELGR